MGFIMCRHVLATTITTVVVLMLSVSLLAHPAAASVERFASFSTAKSPSSYVAASVMHFPHNGSSTPPTDADARRSWARAVVAANLAAYTDYVATAHREHRADIIVFPESGTGYLMFSDPVIPPFCEVIPVPGWSESNCSYDRDSVERPHASWASCAAQRFQMDIVVNYCGKDAVTGHLYNMNAAFLAGSGIAIATYRKSHINAVPILTQPSKPDPVVFVSSFGVEVGLFVCYDLWFDNPVNDDIRSLGARHFAYPNGMASLSPLFTIDQVHAGFSLKHNVTLISAGLFSTGGAGVFHRGEALVINPQWPWANAARNVVAAAVPLSPSAPPTAVKVQRSSSASQEIRVADAKSCFGGSASCAVFTPTANSSFSLRADFAGSNGRVQCEANVSTASTSAHVWMLAASQVTMVPAASNTPNASLGAFCMIMHCDTLLTGCSFGDPSVVPNWQSDLLVSTVAVRAVFSEGYYAANKSHTVAYPVFGTLTAGINQTSTTTAWPLSFFHADEVRYSQNTTLNEYVLETRDRKDGAAYTDFLFSFGIYAAAAGPHS